MIRRRWVLGGLLALGLGGMASAQVQEQSPIRTRVPDAIRTFSADEILREFGPMKPDGSGGFGKVSKTLPKLGRYVPWGGALVIGGAVVNEALHWFYKQAQMSTGTELDRFLDQEETNKIEWRYGVPQTGAYYYDKISDGLWVCYISIRGYDNRSSNVQVFTSKAEQACNSPQQRAEKVIASPPIPNESGFSYSVGSWQLKTASGTTEFLESAYVRTQKTELRPLQDYIPTQTEKDALKNIVDRYLRENPTRLIPLLDPLPNINQQEDNPYADPNLDTDKDGYTDAEEIEKGSDPTDPESKPAPDDPDEAVSTKTVTTRNPDGSTTRTTTTTYADGTKKVVEVTTKTETTTDPDGSKTTKTTTTTKTTDRDGKQTTKTTTKEETTLAPEPPKDKAECEAAGGTWTDGEPGTCALPPKTEKQKECEAAERVWDHVNETCGGKKEDDPTDECGNFAVSRLMKYPGGYLRDLVVPCDDMGDLLSPVVEGMKSKFPFSLTVSLKGWFQDPTGDGAASNLPNKLAVIPLEWGWLSGLWSTIKTLVGVALWAWFIYWLIDRFTPRAEI